MGDNMYMIGRQAYQNILDFGAVGDGVHDDTAALQAAINVASTKNGVFIPNGNFLITTPIIIPNNLTILGAGVLANILYKGSSPFVTIDGGTGIHFKSFKVTLYTDTTLFVVSNAFRNSWDNVTVCGEHLSTNPKPNQRGFFFTANAGDNRIINCDINNLGVGIQTDSIMNYVIGCIFGSCQKGIYGHSASYGAGMTVTGCTFVSNAATTTHHILVDSNANVWEIANCWFEGAGTGLELGSVSGGTYAVGIINCTVAATNYCINIKNAKQTTLINIAFGYDPTTTPVELSIDATNALDGVALNLVSGQSFNISTTFPPHWTVVLRDKVQLPTVSNGLVVQGQTNVQQVGDTNIPFIVSSSGSTTVDQFQIVRGGSTILNVDRYNNLVISGLSVSNATHLAETSIGVSSASKLKFYSSDSANGVTKQTITGAKGGNAALASLITTLATLGLITDSTTA